MKKIGFFLVLVNIIFLTNCGKPFPNITPTENTPSDASQIDKTTIDTTPEDKPLPTSCNTNADCGEGNYCNNENKCYKSIGECTKTMQCWNWGEDICSTDYKCVPQAERRNCGVDRYYKALEGCIQKPCSDSKECQSDFCVNFRCAECYPAANNCPSGTTCYLNPQLNNSTTNHPADAYRCEPTRLKCKSNSDCGLGICITKDQHHSDGKTEEGTCVFTTPSPEGNLLEVDGKYNVNYRARQILFINPKTGYVVSSETGKSTIRHGPLIYNPKITHCFKLIDIEDNFIDLRNVHIQGAVITNDKAFGQMACAGTPPWIYER